MKNEKDKPSYYAILTADVRYDKGLSPSAKLLFGEITCLSNKEGYCFAKNEYFAELYEVEDRTVQRWLRKLEKGKHIVITYYPNPQGQRRIYVGACLPVGVTKMSPLGGATKMSPPGDKNVTPPGDKNVTHNNIKTEYPNLSNTSSPRIQEKEGVADKILKEINQPYTGTLFPLEASADTPEKNIQVARQTKKLVDALFENWFEAYDYNASEATARKLWHKLSNEEHEAALVHTRQYVAATPKRFRKNPYKYLNEKKYNDEIINRNEKANTAKQPITNDDVAGELAKVRASFAARNTGGE